MKPALTCDVPARKLKSENAGDLGQGVPAEVTLTLRMFLLSSALCNLATVRIDETVGQWQTIDEPTEIALQVFSTRLNLGKRSLLSSGWKEIAKFPFDSSIERMSVIYGPPVDKHRLVKFENDVIFTRGAVGEILELCSHIGYGNDREGLMTIVRPRP